MENLLSEQGLSMAQVQKSRLQHGSNTTQSEKRSVFTDVLWGIVKEPMFLLLLVTCIIYFALGQYQDGIIMLAAICLVSGISIFQDYRSANAVKALNKLASPRAKLIREGKPVQVPSEEIVVGDVLLLEEGMIVPADGELIASNDLSINESVLTGEAFSIAKSPENDKMVFKGSLVTSGSGRIQVSAVGKATRFGQIGASLQEVTVERTPLQQQISRFVKLMVMVGVVAFVLVVAFNYSLSGNFNSAFLQGLTLAMSILPEEIPVAFATFLALGAYRLLKKQVIVKQPQYVETLGTATVICVDKTGTLTQNKMEIVALYDAVSHQELSLDKSMDASSQLLEYAMWSSETTPFDPMEKAIHSLYENTTATDLRPLYNQVHEYPLSGTPPMMTHVFSNKAGENVIAVKGAPEAVLKCSDLTEAQKNAFLDKSREYANKGYRVLGVGKATGDYKEWPEKQEEFSFRFLGLIVFEDPIKPGIPETINSFRKAGIQVKMITGDYAGTALAIATQAGLDTSNAVLTGEAIREMPEALLKQQVLATSIFVRMFPEAKLKVVNALKSAGEIVAMTGDGVNDAPALKAAHIGIAMGKRGSEVAKNAASLILANDELTGMTDAIALGRKIYNNLKKAIRYIISIHIPIILIVTLPLLLHWAFTDIFSPVHVIFLELIMGPTCSIIYENEPVEKGTMTAKPRKTTYSFLTFRQLFLSIVQGLAITVGCLITGYYYLQAGYDHETVRTVIFITLLFSNIFLTQLNRSFEFSVIQTLRYRNALVPLVILVTLIFIVCMLYVPAVRNLFSLSMISTAMLLTCIGVAAVSTFWVEIVKLIYRKKSLVR
ncbi:MAG: cation-translocating P-type ATPase [Pseudobacter sp.]|uniref:cation-translocating P-type ATPase n=1 Tax=Pseudobacter sp. TaxID=2045420 RepID=UPI003F7D64B1